MDFKIGQLPLDGQDEENRGNSLVLPPPPLPPGGYDANGQIIGPNKTVTQFETRGLGAHSIGVCLGLTLEGQDNNSQTMKQDDFVLPSVRCTLNWGYGGCKMNAECDWINGTQFPVSGEDLRIGARYIKTTRPWDPSISEIFPTYRVNCGFGYFSTGKNSNPARFTEVVQLENPQDSKIIKIPDFAVSWTLLPVDGAAIGVRMMGFGTSYGVRYQQPLLAGEGERINNASYNVENAIPLFNGARFIEVFNDEDAGEAIGFLIFGLSFG